MGILVVIFIIGWILISLLRGMGTNVSAPATRTRGARHVCPVCAYAYSDPRAPIIAQGSPNPANHRCDRTGTWRVGARYGLSLERFYQRLATVTEAELQGWPVVARMRHDYLARQAN